MRKKYQSFSVHHVKLPRRQSFDYVRISEVPKAHRKEFEKWMDGQTRPIIDGLAPHEQDACYLWDWHRWLLLNDGHSVSWD